MSTYTARVTVPGDGRLVLDLPEEMASGDVEVTVRPCVSDQSERPFPQLAPLFEKWKREREAGAERTEDERKTEFDALMREWDSFETELPPRGSSAALLLLDRQFARGGWRGTNRTKEEIDQSIRELRDEWDDDGPLPPPRGTTAAILALEAQLEREGWKGTTRTTEEIDRSLRELRDEWDDD